MSIQVGLLLALVVAVGVLFAWLHRATAPASGAIAHAADRVPVEPAADERR